MSKCPKGLNKRDRICFYYKVVPRKGKREITYDNCRLEFTYATKMKTIPNIEV